MEDLILTSPFAWVVLGLSLLLFEVSSQVFILFFFGISALVVSALAWQAGLHDFLYQVLTFTILGVGGVVIFRKKLRTRFAKSIMSRLFIDEDQLITLTEKISPRGQGQIQYQGAPWTVVNDSDRELSIGEKAKITQIEETEIRIQPLSS